MANRERGELAWGRYTLRLTPASCVAIETRTGQTLDGLTAKANKGQIGAIRWLLWASLQAQHDLEIGTLEDAGQLIDRHGGVGAITAVLAELLELNVDDSDDLPATKATTGKPKPDSKPSWRRWYLEARSAGVGIEEFWHLSLKELWRELARARQEAKRDRDRDLTLAWHCAALVWQKKLPSLERLLSRGERRQTPDEAKAAVLQIGELYGLKVRKKPKRKKR